MRLFFDVGLEAEKTANNSNDKLEAVVNMLIGMRKPEQIKL
jgi:hypothetical protein